MENKDISIGYGIHWITIVQLMGSTK